MAFDYKVNPDFDFTFDEKGNTFLALRKISWGEGKPEKLDIRKYYNTSDGGETLSKGVSFITDEGPHELTRILLENNYGHTDEVISSIKDRGDFMSSLVRALDNSVIESLNIDTTNTINEEYYDPSEALF